VRNFLITVGIFIVAGMLGFLTLCFIDTPREKRQPWLIALFAFLTVATFATGVYVLSL
jgi:hypothetical protein